MQDFRAEISKLGGFAVRQSLDRLRFGNHSWIGGQHSGNVGPDLYLTRAERRADQCRRVIGTSASESCGCAANGRRR